jgi:DNA-binding NtrC family response regulator
MMTVLLVDDNALVLRSLVRLLTGRFEVHTAASAAEAMERLRQSPCEVVVTDLEMPGEDGLQLLARVRDEFPAVKRVVMSGSPTLSRALGAPPGLVHVSLPKPFQKEQLMSALET